MNEFIMKLMNEVQKRLGDTYSLEQVTSIKNNNRKLIGIQIKQKDSRVCPVFYVENIFKEYEQGIRTLDECASTLEHEVLNPIHFTLDTSMIEQYETSKANIRIKLINYEANKELLSDAPHLRLLDLAAAFYVCFDISHDTKGTFLVTNQILHKWNIDTDIFIKDSMDTLLRKEYTLICDMQDMLSMLVCPVEEENLFDLFTEHASLKGHLYVLTNTERHFGANMLLNKAALHQFATAHDDNLIIYPSSIHECLITFESDLQTLRLLPRDIAHINRYNVSPEDRLSNNVYLYDRHLKEISILHQGISLAEL
ncbi:MAG: hypothetical protein J6B50_11510 [Lachnospiraceae bacterium]|nr:hypothetical protein [Lachnospiraceae bacterium]MBP3595216.1 hypothetical protein [Lachnospiraceae bacterium]